LILIFGNTTSYQSNFAPLIILFHFSEIIQIISLRFVFQALSQIHKIVVSIQVAHHLIEDIAFDEARAKSLCI
jgi:hypothetical protein